MKFAASFSLAILCALMPSLVLAQTQTANPGTAQIVPENTSNSSTLTASQLPTPANDEGPAIQIEGSPGNGCSAGATAVNGECYSCPAGYTLSGTLCNPPESATIQPAPDAQPTTQTTSANSDTGFVPIAPIPGLTQGATADRQGLANFLNNLYKYLVGAAAALAVILIIWGGLEISTQDSISSQSAGRERITQAILGLVLVLSPVLVFSLINPSILNLTINVSPLETKWGTFSGSGNPGTPTVTTPTESGTYTMGIDSDYLKTAGAADQAGADKFFSDKCTGFSEKNTSCKGNTKGPDGCTQGTIVWCSKTLGVTSYYWKYACIAGYACVGDRFVGIAPSYASDAQTFTNGCQSAGGKVWEKGVDGSTPVIPLACTDTTGFKPYDSTEYSGYSCNYQDELRCDPVGQ